MEHGTQKIGALVYTKSGNLRSALTCRVIWKKNFSGDDKPWTERGDKFNPKGSPSAEEQFIYLLGYIDKHFFKMRKFQLYDNRKPEGEDLILMIDNMELLAFNMPDEWITHAMRILGNKLKLIKSLN